MKKILLIVAFLTTLVSADTLTEMNSETNKVNMVHEIAEGINRAVIWTTEYEEFIYDYNYNLLTRGVKKPNTIPYVTGTWIIVENVNDFSEFFEVLNDEQVDAIIEHDWNYASVASSEDEGGRRITTLFLYK